jgi:nucleotide-binding universal stress UspA family protein
MGDVLNQRRPISSPEESFPPVDRQPDRGSSLADEVSRFLATVPHAATPVPTADGRGGAPHAIGVLLPISGSEHTRQVVDEMINLAKVMPVEVRVVHLREFDLCRGVRFFERTQDEAMALTRVAVTHLRSRGVDATGLIRPVARSDVARGIVREAAGNGSSLVVIGAPRRRRLSVVVRRDVVAHVVRRATCPVLVVPTTQRDGTRVVRQGSLGRCI